MNSVLHKVIAIVAEQFGENISDLTPDTHFVKDLRASLDLVEAIMACEEEFGIHIPDEEAEKLVTIGLLAKYIESRLEPDNTVWPPAPKMPMR